ncbi:MAG: NfeD family protein [Bacteroidota bacterium]
MEVLQAFFGVSTPLEAIFWVVAVGSSSLLGIKTILALIGLDLDVDLDFDIAGDDVSLSAVLTFLGLGSWSGVLLSNQTELGEGSVLIASIFSGIVGFVTMVLLVKRMKGLEDSGNVEIDNAIGKTADVYLGIPAGREGEGQVQILVQGRLMIYEALTEGKKIETGEKVLVYDVEGGKLLVEKYDNKALTT